VGRGARDHDRDPGELVSGLLAAQAHDGSPRLRRRRQSRPDPTRTHGKDARRAKAIELEGWDYPRHLAGRLFSVVVHGDAEGAEGVRRSLADWLSAMRLVSAGTLAEVDRYIGYWQPYATSHEALDGDQAIQEEVRNAARTLIEAAQESRAGRQVSAGRRLHEPRRK
jgi:hypothetical protein